jgi:SAM-dependent methyltransferase
MRQELLAILACPHCESSDLYYSGSIDTDDQVLVCRQCNHRYGFENNIPLLYKDDEFWAPKKREAAGWVSMWKDIGLYDIEHQVDPELPFVSTEPWATIGRMFRAALFQMDLRGGERVLDIGAGEGWASQHFTQRGCHAVAIDVVADKQLGLGRSWKRMACTGTVFDLLIGDNERLPFQPNTFDFVFSSNTLHHSDNLDHLMQNIFRVLRPGGRLIAIGDPLTTIFQQESDMKDGDREKAHGIIERRRRFYHYLLQVWRAGFRNIHFEDEKTFWKKNSELYPWIDIERYEIEQNRLLGTTTTTKALTWAMLRLPRPFALAMLLSLRKGGLLLISGQKPS